MLQLRNISKTYKMTNNEVKALKDISVSFRKNEFVAILGPSGSGKTTLLNLIGGLDQYTSGNLLINGRETKDYKEKDWNVYRSHRVGFVFQSYNLIPHQTVLSNVELALTIAGISKEERVKRAKAALDEVGLADQYYKKPNQLSGGQSQRVAIARALVNNPEILLADEPTGALDTKTGRQIMDLIQTIAKDRLVVMVTHNPELANEYANRVINLLDGELITDTNPYDSKTESADISQAITTIKQKERAKMSLWTSFKLSLQNLFSKKSRTILTSVASAIGIIGISLVLSLSTGVQNYIDEVQEDMLSGNPITISTQGVDLAAMFSSMGQFEKVEVIKEINKVGVDQVIKRITESSSSMQDIFVENNITQDYIDYLNQMPTESVAAIFYNREVDVANNIYLDFVKEDGTTTNLSVLGLRTIMTAILEQNPETKEYAALISNFTNVINEAPNNVDYLSKQYNLLGDSKIASEKDEIMLVLNQDGLISDLTLAQLGFYTQEEFQNIIFDVLEDPNYNSELKEITHFDYETILNKTFTWHSNDLVFTKTDQVQTPFTYEAYSDNFNSNADSLELKIVGILQLKDEVEYGSLNNGFYFTEELTNHIVDSNLNSEIVTYLNDNEAEQIVSGQFTPTAITFDYDYTYLGTSYQDTSFVGQTDPMSAMFESIPGIGDMPKSYKLTKRHLGGEELPSLISIYPTNIDQKDEVVAYLDAWNTNNSADDRITYSDPLSLIFVMIGSIINIITIALIGFTSLSLFVSSVMIAIITYISVVERVKEIGVIRSLGGSKQNVTNLFISENFIIGLTAALIAIGFTYLFNLVLNTALYSTVKSNISIFPLSYAGIMILISVGLTLISGFIPSRSAAKKDPVDALRAE